MRTWTKLLVITLSLLLVFSLAGCGGNEEPEQERNQVDQQGKADSKYIQIKGSDTEVNLVQQLAEVYMEDSDVQLSVTGGGSGTGISALINGQVDIANASRTMKDEEIAQAQNNQITPVRVVIAMDGLSVIINANNPVKELTIGQLAGIFKGEISNWSEVGGPDAEISLYGRQSNSGTFVYFRDQVLKGDYSAEMKRMNGNAQLVEGIKADEAGIGYVGVGYVVDEAGNTVEGLKIINLARDENSRAVSPLNPENVENGSYPLARPLNQYLNGKPAGALLDFINFELSKKGQDIAVEQGFYPISPEFKELNQQTLGQ